MLHFLFNSIIYLNSIIQGNSTIQCNSLIQSNSMFSIKNSTVPPSHKNNNNSKHEMTQWRYETREGRTPHNDIRRTDAPNKERVALWKRNTAKCTVKRGIRVIPQKSKLDAHGSQKNKNGYHTVAIRENENIRLSRKENKKK